MTKFFKGPYSAREFGADCFHFNLRRPKRPVPIQYQPLYFTAADSFDIFYQIALKYIVFSILVWYNSI